MRTRELEVHLERKLATQLAESVVAADAELAHRKEKADVSVEGKGEGWIRKHQTFVLIEVGGE